MASTVQPRCARLDPRNGMARMATSKLDLMALLWTIDIASLIQPHPACSPLKQGLGGSS